MSLDPITDIVRRGILNLQPSYWGKPRIASALRALLEGVQEVETATQEVIATRTIDGAHRNQLRVLGELVGQPDTGLDLEDYRKAVKARALANRSRGNVDDLLKVFAVFHAGVVNWQAIPPAKLRLFAEGLGTVPMQTVLGLLGDARAGGVGLDVMWAPGVGNRFSSSTGGAFGAGEMSSANRDLLTILGQTPSSQLSGFDLPVGPGATWTWPAVIGSSFDTSTAAIGSGWLGLPTARLESAGPDSLLQVSTLISDGHTGQLNLPWAVIGAVNVDSGQAVSGDRALWSVSTVLSSSGYKFLGINWATGLTVYRQINDAAVAFEVTGVAFPLDIEVIVAHYFDGTNITVLALDPLSGDISTLIPATALGATGALAAPDRSALGAVRRAGSDLNLDFDIRAMCWVNSPTFGLDELKDAMRHLALVSSATLPGVGGTYSIAPGV
jgi:hypothetical protein